MINLENIPEHLRAWFEKDVLPELERLRTDATTAENWAKEHAQLLLNEAQRFLTAAQNGLKVAQSVASLLGPEGVALVEGAEAIVADAQEGVTEAQAFLAKVLGS
jgi:hypothetical protein